MRKIFVYIVLVVTMVAGLKAQDPQLSQFYSASLYLAPSFAGSTRGGRAAMLYRNQWPGIKNQFNTGYFALDYFYPRYNSGVGFYVLRDAAGSGKLVSNNYQVQYSYLLKVYKNFFVRPGFQLGYISRSIDYNRLVFGDQLSFDGNAPVSNETQLADRIHLFDYAASLLMFIPSSWLGVTVEHLPFSNQSFLGTESLLPMKVVVFGGYKHVINRRLLVRSSSSASASFIYKKQGQFQQLDVGAYFDRYPLQIGVWYRGLPIIKNKYNTINQDAIVTKIGLMYDMFSLGYSYDFTTSRLRSFSGGAHEVSIVVLYNQYQVSRKKYRPVPCPDF